MDKLNKDINLTVTYTLWEEYESLPQHIRSQIREEMRRMIARECMSRNHLDYERYGLKRGEE